LPGGVVGKFYGKHVRGQKALKGQAVREVSTPRVAGPHRGLAGIAGLRQIRLVTVARRLVQNRAVERGHRASALGADLRLVTRRIGAVGLPVRFIQGVDMPADHEATVVRMHRISI
jgi:hypothetical protein